MWEISNKSYWRNKLEDVKKKTLISLNWLKTLIVMNWTIYCNLKMICGSGGGQTRALREVYHFISAQQRHLNQELSSKTRSKFVELMSPAS